MYSVVRVYVLAGTAWEPVLVTVMYDNPRQAESIGNEAKVVVQHSAGRLAKKSGKPYSETTNIVKSRMSLAI